MADLSAVARAGVRSIERIDALDDIAKRVEPIVQRFTASNVVKRTLSGAPLGHRLHPLLTDIPIGTWTSATFLDLLAWRSGSRAAQRLTGIGVLAAVPTAASGLSDWADTYGAAKRIGVVHMASNTIALGFEFASWSARRKGHHVRGALLGLGGLAAVSIGGYLGGHLIYVLRSGVDAEVRRIQDDEWHEICPVDELVDAQPVGFDVAGARVVLVRRADEVFALAAKCTHAGGPLDQGRVTGEAIECPWHGSQFCLRDGAVERGPATTPEPTYAARIRAGLVEIATYEATSGPTRPSPTLPMRR